MPPNLVRLLALLAAAVLVLGACGGDDDGDSAATTSTTAAPADLGSDDDDDTTTTTGDAPRTTAPAGSRDLPNLGGVNDFCDLFTMFDDFDDDIFFGDDPDMSPEESNAAMAQGFQFMEALFVRAVQLAPNEIRGDMSVFADAMAEYNSLLAEYDYDFMALTMAGMDDPEIEARFAALETDEFDAASSRIEAYVLDECGVDLS